MQEARGRMVSSASAKRSSTPTTFCGALAYSILHLPYAGHDAQAHRVLTSMATRDRLRLDTLRRMPRCGLPRSGACGQTSLLRPNDIHRNIMKSHDNGRMACSFEAMLKKTTSFPTRTRLPLEISDPEIGLGFVHEHVFKERRPPFVAMLNCRIT